MSKGIKNIEGVLLLGISFVIPLLFLPLFQNPLVTVKLTVLVYGVITLLFLFFIRTILNKKFEIHTGPFDIPLLVIFIGTLLSALLKTPNKMEAFFLPGSASIIMAGILFYFLVNQASEKIKKQIPVSIYYSSVLCSIISLLAISRVFGSVPGFPAILKDPTFTTIGGNLGAFVFLVATIPTGLSLAVSEGETVKRIFYYLSLLIVTFGIAGNLYNLLPGRETAPNNLSTTVSWSIAIDSIKVSPILGIGPANYLTAFNQFRPISYNQTPNWNIKFINSNNTYLTLITELGLLGTGVLIVLLMAIVNRLVGEFREKKETDWGLPFSPETLSMALSTILLAISSSTLSMYLVFFSFLAVASKTKKHLFNLESQEEGRFAGYVPSILISLPVFVAISYIFLTSFKLIDAEFTYNKALLAIAKNDGKSAYELLTKTVSQNQLVDRYHATAAQIDYALANSIATKPEGQTITDEERGTITQLIQQAIAEGKAAVSLNPTRSGNWSLLANLYKSVMAFAKGSDQFAIQTFNQAVALDPLDPGLRISLGGIYFALGDYDSAIDTFKTAVLAKPDLANARYNLAVAYREKGDIERAITEMTLVIELVDRNTQDYDTAKKELDALIAKRPKTSPTPTSQISGPETLETPEPTQKPIVSPQIELPVEAEPPTVSIEPESISTTRP